MEVLPDGTINLRRLDNNAIVGSSNLFDDFTTNLGRIQNNHLLNRVTLVNPATGAVVAEYRLIGGAWVRTL